MRVNDQPAHARLRHQEHQPRRLLPRQGQGWPPCRIRIADEVYITTLLAAAFGNISHAVEVAYGAKRKDTHEEPNGARFGNISHAAEVSYGAELENAARAVLYGAVAHDVPLK